MISRERKRTIRSLAAARKIMPQVESNTSAWYSPGAIG
jgi:hypothetical protein